MEGHPPIPSTLTVLLVGFNPVVREGLQAILARDEKTCVVGHCENGEDALAQLRRYSGRGRPVEVVMTEPRNNQMDGVEATKLIKNEFPAVAVLVLTESDNDSNVIDAIQAGAGGYIFLKDVSPGTLLQNVHRVVEGGMQMKTELLRKAVDALIQNGRKTLAERTAEATHLTPREVDVLRLLGNGDSNKTIAEALSISLDTTKKHVRNIVSKLGARSRTHAAIVAARAGIVGNPVTPLVRHAAGGDGSKLKVERGHWSG